MSDVIQQPHTLSAIVLVNIDSLPFLDRTLQSLSALQLSQLVIAWSAQDTTVIDLKECSIPYKVVPVVNATWDVSTMVRRGVEAATGDWVLVLFAGEQIAPEGHASWKVDERNVPSGKSLDKILAQDWVSALQSVYWTADAPGNQALSYTSECRLARSCLASGATWGSRGFVANETWEEMSPEGLRLPILKQSLPAAYYELGDNRKAMTLAGNSRIDRRFYLKARARHETTEAFTALEKLFMHMSLNEELCRLERIMQNLPFDLEEDPRVDRLRALLHEQIGHLDSSERDWYADGSPGEVCNKEMILYPPALTARLQWLVEECRKQGYKRVLELGSVDGFNLFQLQHAAPEIEWHGVEVSEKAVKHGHLLAQQTGRTVNLHHVPDFSYASRYGPFDAVAVFEVLEHNKSSTRILNNAISCIVGGVTIDRGVQRPWPNCGHIYISTPEGNWSAFDENTRNVHVRKDHINAYTVRRMQRAIEDFVSFSAEHVRITDVRAFSIENPSIEENNSWVFASFKVERAK